MPSPPRTSRSQLLDGAWDVIRRWQDHGAYGTREKAQKALAWRHPGFTPRQYANALAKAATLHAVAAEIVVREIERLLAQTDVATNRFPEFTDEHSELRQRCRGFATATYRTALMWTLFWDHLK